jgi:pimeloyl-ACP methyl ester carboxylesterase
MSIIPNNGVEIHYQVEGQGHPLVLQHGGFGSIEDWYEYGYVAALRDHYRLILIDARAHGKSGKPYDVEQYSPKLHASDIVAVLDEIKVEKCHYLGFSLGARIGYWMARFYPKRLLSLMVLGMDPYPHEMSTIEKAAETIDIWGPTVPNVSEKHKSRWLENDKRALIASVAKPWPDDSHVLHPLSIACLIACGDRDELFEGAKRSASEIKGATFVQCDGFDHIDIFVRSDVIMPYIIAFLASVDA